MIQYTPTPDPEQRDSWTLSDHAAHYISSVLGKIQRQDGFMYWNSDQSSFLQVSHFHPSDLPIGSLGEKLDDLIGYELAGNIKRNPDDVDMDDPRVRQFIEDEVKPIRFWMAMGQELAQGKSVLEVFDTFSVRFPS
jgi:hypothetical protein